MGTIKRLNDQQKQQAQAEAAMPGAYENRYDEGIQNALAGMDSANSAGLGFDSQNGTYRGALSRLFGNAGAGASAAEQVANSLSGGYGTDWAKSAAQQAATGETGQTANVYAQARADALSQWRQELAGQGTQLNNLLTQDQLARNEHDGSVQNAADWRSYRYGRTQQARQENSDFLSNVWNVIKNVGSDVGKAYNAYMGYSQQKANAIVQAKEEYRNGNVDGAKAILKMYRMDENMFDGIFYEFVPLEEVDKENPRAYCLEEVELNKNYAMVISTSCGLWRYMIGDTVKFTGKNPYKFVITGRTKHFINAFGEELIVDNAEKGLAKACSETGAQVSEYSAAPVFMDEHAKCRHQWLIEFAKMPDSVEKFAAILDATLKEVNSDYEAKRWKDIA